MADPDLNASSHIVEEGAEAVAFENVKVGGGGPSYWTNLAMAQAVNQQHQTYQIGNAITAKAAEMILNTSPSEGTVDSAIAGVLAKLSSGFPSQVKYTEGG